MIYIINDTTYAQRIRMPRVRYGLGGDLTLMLIDTLGNTVAAYQVEDEGDVYSLDVDLRLTAYLTPGEYTLRLINDRGALVQTELASVGERTDKEYHDVVQSISNQSIKQYEQNRQPTPRRY